METIINGKRVNISFSKEAERHTSKVLSSILFQNYKNNLDPRFVVHKIHIDSVTMFGPNKLGFIHLTAQVTDNDNNFIPGTTFLRGGTVALLVILECDGKEYALLTVQSRSPVGIFEFVGLPAGMVDEDSFAGAAAKEIQEETGMSFTQDELIDMTSMLYGEDNPVIYPSAGASDESAKYYLARRTVSKQELQSLQGKLTGELSEGERITLKIVPLKNLIKEVRAGHSLVALALYNELYK